MAKSIILADNVSVTYNLGKSNEFRALQGETIDIAATEYIILFGPSGCGKSTLLFSVLGVLPPNSGKIYVSGESIYDYSVKEMNHYQRFKIGIMYQSFNLINSINVMDNVALPMIFAGIHPAKRQKRAMALMERFGIADLGDKLPANLSGGQMQRVSVARSLVNDPEILLADEPVGNLDAVSADAVMDTLEEINIKDKKTVILVTHDAKYLPYAHRTYFLKYGGVDRIVTNPEKKQIKQIDPGTTITTELEQLARLYPYIDPSELRVKSVVNYITQKFSFDQITRLEKIVQDVVNGKMSQEIFMRVLMEEYDRGGVGIDIKSARDMGETLTRLLKQSINVARVRKLKEGEGKAVVSARHPLIKKIRQNVLDEIKIEITDEQEEKIDVIVYSRVSGYTNKEELKEQLVLPIEQGGGGLTKRNMHEFARYLEKLIAQGVNIFEKNTDNEH